MIRVRTHRFEGATRQMTGRFDPTVFETNQATEA